MEERVRRFLRWMLVAERLIRQVVLLPIVMMGQGGALKRLSLSLLLGQAAPWMTVPVPTGSMLGRSGLSGPLSQVERLVSATQSMGIWVGVEPVPVALAVLP